MRTGKLIVWALTLTALAGCSDDGGPVTDSFDRSAMLTSVADEIIIPSIDSTRISAEVLQSSCEGALSDEVLDETEITELRGTTQTLMRRWQRMVTFNFGPAEGDVGTLVQELGTFPCDTAAIESLIQSAYTAMNDFRRDTRGLATIDYLLWSAGDVSQVAGRFAGPGNQNRRVFLKSVIRRIASELRAVGVEWKQSYRSVFIKRNGTDAGSSVSLLFNDLNRSFELLKNFKLALPLGLRAGQTSPEPKKIEAFYSGMSYELLGLHYRSIREIWSGRLDGGNEIVSFRDYLVSVVNGPRLIEETEAQFARVDAAYAVVSQSRMDELIRTNPQALVQLHTELQKLTRFLKSEMSSLLGISITYSSGDGD